MKKENSKAFWDLKEYLIYGFHIGLKGEIKKLIIEIIKTMDLPIVEGELCLRYVKNKELLNEKWDKFKKISIEDLKNLIFDKITLNEYTTSLSKLSVVLEKDDYKLLLKFFLGNIFKDARYQFALIAIGEEWLKVPTSIKNYFNKKLLDLVKNYDMDIVDFGHAIPADESGLK